MQLLDTIIVQQAGRDRSIKLYSGDLSALPQGESVDVLVVSAFPDDYTPTRTSLIGSLSNRGISVRELALDKEVDLRKFSSCWISKEISQSQVGFRRILCFEPRYRGRAPEVVGDIFRCIIPLATSRLSIREIAMPLVASGGQGEPAAEMLEALIEASVHWLGLGLPLDCIKIILRNSNDLDELANSFSAAKNRLAQPPIDPVKQAFDYDVFVSYSQKDKEAVDLLVTNLRDNRPRFESSSTASN